MAYSKKELLKKLSAPGIEGGYALSLRSELFSTDIPVNIYAKSGNMEKDISEYVVSCFNMIFELDAAFLLKAKEEIWQHYQAVLINYNDGALPDPLIEEHGGDEEKANLEYFGYKDMESTYAAAKMRSLYIEGDETNAPGRFFSIIYAVPWDDEHGIWLGVAEKKIIHVE